MGIALASIAQRCVSTPGDHLHTGKSSRDIVFDPSMKPSTSQENFLANPNNKTRLKTLGNLTPHQAARWDRDSVEAGSWGCWSTHLRRSSWGPTSGHGPGSGHRCTGDTCCNHPFESKGSLWNNEVLVESKGSLWNNEVLLMCRYRWHSSSYWWLAAASSVFPCFFRVRQRIRPVWQGEKDCVPKDSQWLGYLADFREASSCKEAIACAGEFSCPCMEVKKEQVWMNSDTRLERWCQFSGFLSFALLAAWKFAKFHNVHTVLRL